MGLVLREGMTLVGVGLVLGLAGALAVSRVVAGLLYGITPTDVPTFGGVSLVLVVVALVACGVPAFRASRLDPVVALR
jgi:ABC-type antimicrobial peptide transport system permease subunit